MSAIKAAIDRARDDVHHPLATSAPDGQRRTRQLAIGDPQAPFETFLAILERHRALDANGRLKPEVFLVSIGDHFDWGEKSGRAKTAEDGLRLLSWLSAHPTDQVVAIAGNHDLARVGELANFDDATFAAAQAEAVCDDGSAAEERERRFLERYPEIPTAQVVARDFSGFRIAQRELVIALLRSRRMHLAYPYRRNVLLCHAGVTADDLGSLGLSSDEQADAYAIARALNDALERAVDHWQQGPFAIPGLHAPGSAALGEGRGVLYHRPANPAEGKLELHAGPPRRRFDPRRLPIGITQVIGHIRDKKCRELLGRSADDSPPKDGVLRHLYDGRS